MVHNFGFVLRSDAGDETLAFCFRNSKAFVGLADVFRKVLPRLRLALGGLDEVFDVVEIDRREVGAPVRHRLGEEQFEGLEATLEHPLRFVLSRRDVPYYVGVDAAACAGSGRIRVVPSEFVLSESVKFRSVNNDVAHE